jgi:AhpD family alkylhydroperoxidase
MTARMTNPATILPQATKAIPHLFGAMEQGGLSASLREILALRISQINGCAACVYSHVKALQADDESDDRISTVAVWRESPFFTSAERAALELAEHATRLSDARGHAVPDPVWDDAADNFDEKELAAIILLIATTNFFNRINVTIGEPAGTTWG